jgi:hypothetical protein
MLSVRAVSWESPVREGTRIVNRIKSALARLGIRSFKPDNELRKAPQRLAAPRTREDRPLPPTFSMRSGGIRFGSPCSDSRSTRLRRLAWLGWRSRQQRGRMREHPPGRQVCCCITGSITSAWPSLAGSMRMLCLVVRALWHWRRVCRMRCGRSVEPRCSISATAVSCLRNLDENTWQDQTRRYEALCAHCIAAGLQQPEPGSRGRVTGVNNFSQIKVLP